MRSILSRMSQNFDSILPLSCMTWGGETYTLTKPLSKASIIFKNIFRGLFFQSQLEPCKVKNPTETSRMSRECYPFVDPT